MVLDPSGYKDVTQDPEVMVRPLGTGGSSRGVSGLQAFLPRPHAWVDRVRVHAAGPGPGTDARNPADPTPPLFVTAWGHR